MENQHEQLFTKQNLVWVIVASMLAIVFWYLPPIAARQDALYRVFTPLLTVKSQIQKRYVEDVDDTTLIDGALHGMVNSLDPHSQYLDPAEYAVFKEHMKGDYEGIGVSVDLQGDRIIVVSPIENSPAFEAGVRAGDEIVEVGGKPVTQFRSDEVSKMLRGVEGSMAHFKVRRPPNGQIIAFSVPRRKIQTRVVFGFRRKSDATWDFMIDPDDKIGYLRIGEFWDNTVPEFDQAIAQLQQEGVRGLILDLRFNPGGDIQATKDLVDRFLSGGVIVTTRTRRQVVETISATPQHDLPDWPVAVLINNYSASGAEITAGSLQEHQRATIVGERSFGKASVQEFIELPDENGIRDQALKLTIAYYYLPSGRCIHRRPDSRESDDWGIQPDVVVDTTVMEKIEIQSGWQRASVIQNDHAEQTSIPLDKQLTRALEVLREKLQGSRN